MTADDLAKWREPDFKSTESSVYERPDFVRIPITNKALVITKTAGEAAGQVEWWKEGVFPWGKDDAPIITGFGSSTLEDTDGDVFTEHCLHSMAHKSYDPVPLNILLNHDPTAPGSIFGSLVEKPEIEKQLIRGSEHYLLTLRTDVDPLNKEAIRTYHMIAGTYGRARQLGFSVGCIYTDYEPRRDKSGRIVGVKCNDNDPVEYSVVTMPANRGAWITNVGKAFKARKLIPSDDLMEKDTLYVIKNAQDFTDDPIVAARLHQLGELLSEHGIYLAARRAA